MAGIKQVVWDVWIVLNINFTIPLCNLEQGFNTLENVLLYLNSPHIKADMYYQLSPNF